MARKATAKLTDEGELPESKSARTRGRILDAAAHVLSIKGYAGTRLTDVAEYAELQAPAIYYYFPSREELIEEVMWVGIADMRRHVLAVLDAVDPASSPMDRILVAVEAHLRHELEISDYTTASIRNAGQLPESIRARQVAEEAKYGKIWQKLFKDAADEGQIRDDLDVKMARMLVIGALNWAAEWWNPRRGSLDTVVATAQSIVSAGLSPKTTSTAAAAPRKTAAPARPRRRSGQTAI
ncbi:TetR/AcrR family transcriptional regulator [Rhodococcus sp. 14-2483-1-1]|jgi:AcrR family transcriptional regulator|uniref:TetR/AcrR family transcriptional regulator n=1 Tax=Nocardiaceae TaxID=85025 RepID=UPI00050BDA68|nr:MULTISPECIES: TetR/AcrR family transcriptional regulator [Rhodococcus]OZE99748.1 TetR/AcrR family transcriptional regulator [Rhodococcus sp. 15-2388-1-1a]OZF40594.1 TetR/AcrR family transcriptional regulator [Rhodococcus sp. 14-2483-1-1]